MVIGIIQPDMVTIQLVGRAKIGLIQLDEHSCFMFVKQGASGKALGFIGLKG